MNHEMNSAIWNFATTVFLVIYIYIYINELQFYNWIETPWNPSLFVILSPFGSHPCVSTSHSVFGTSHWWLNTHLLWYFITVMKSCIGTATTHVSDTTIIGPSLIASDFSSFWCFFATKLTLDYSGGSHRVPYIFLSKYCFWEVFPISNCFLKYSSIRHNDELSGKSLNFIHQFRMISKSM